MGPVRATSVIDARTDITSMDWVRTGGVRIAVVLVLATLVSWLGRLAVRRMQRRMSGPPDATLTLNLRRAATMTSILTNAVRVLVWSVAVLMILGELGLNLGPLLAGAGVLGLALGFGAQTIVRDFLSGFFVLLENQYGVGDFVTFVVGPGGGERSGRVERVSLRSTSIRGSDGTLSTTGNGYLILVNNRSRGRGTVLVEMRVPRVADVGEVERRLEDFAREARDDEQLRRILSAGPHPVGVDPTGGDEVVVSVAAETRPARREEVERELRRRMQRRFLPYPQQPSEPGRPAGQGDRDTSGQ